MTEAISDFEKLVLRAVATTAPDAYGVSIIDYITNNVSSEPAHTRVYAALERLEGHYMIGKKWAPGGPERGGRSKLMWSLTPIGRRVLESPTAGQRIAVP